MSSLLHFFELLPDLFKRREHIAIAALLTLSLTQGSALASPLDDDAARTGVKESAASLLESRPAEAIRKLESLADRGIEHPDLAFNRGLAYAARAKTPRREISDLGQAAAGFAETLQFRPSDEEAGRALRETQLEVARKHSKKKTSSERESLGLIEKVLHSLSALWLFAIAVTGSTAATIGLLLRFSSRETYKLSGLVAAGIGAFCLFASSALFFGKQGLFEGSHVAVVIAEQARLLDEGGARLKGELPLRQSTLVHLGSAQRGLAPLIGLGQKRWIRLSQVRVLVTP